MQFLTDTKIDFMRYRFVLMVFSIALIAAGLLYVFVLGKLKSSIALTNGTDEEPPFPL